MQASTLLSHHKPSPPTLRRNAIRPRASGCLGQENGPMERAITVKLFLARKPAGTGSSVRLSGNYARLGWWEPEQAVVLTPRSGGRWGAEIRLPSGVEYEFKFLGVDTQADGSLASYWESNIDKRKLMVKHLTRALFPLLPLESYVVEMSDKQTPSLTITSPALLEIPPKAIAANVFCRWGEPRMEVFIEEPRYEQDILNMLALPCLGKGKILMVGSSIFREWVNAPRDLEPLPVINRAFGGSLTSDQLDRLEQIVLPLEPRVVVYYCGSNDINAGVPADKIASNFVEFSARVRAALAGTRIIYVAITRCPEKTDKFHLVDAVNIRVKAFCDEQEHHLFLDINHLLVSPGGSPRYELFQDDMLHFQQAAYQEVFVPFIRPRLQEVWNSALSDQQMSSASSPPSAL